MPLIKCPRCELNYILDGGDLCTICREEVRGKRAADDGVFLCSVCGEIPALPGEDMCRACLTEMRSIEALSTDGDEERPVEAAELDPEPVSGLDEIESADSIDSAAEDQLDLADGMGNGDLSGGAVDDGLSDSADGLGEAGLDPNEEELADLEAGEDAE